MKAFLVLDPVRAHSFENCGSPSRKLEKSDKKAEIEAAIMDTYKAQ